jgi:hypothetical protein
MPVAKRNVIWLGHCNDTNCFLSFRRFAQRRGGICYLPTALWCCPGKQIPPRRYAPCRNDKGIDMSLTLQLVGGLHA